MIQIDTHYSRRNRIRALAGLVAVLLVVGCAATPTVSHKLDLITGVTVTFSGVPLVMYRESPAHAAFARNYVYMGPIQVNRSGSYQYFLWLGAWNTMQIPDALQNQDNLESVIIFADGEPLSLEVAGWTPEVIGTSEPVYQKPVASTTDAYYRVTADQIRLIVEARNIRLRISGADPREFELWDEQAAARRSLVEFLNQTI